MTKEKEITIKELLESFIVKKDGIDTSTITWERIGARSSFSELGIEKDELDEVLKAWIAENEYENL